MVKVSLVKGRKRKDTVKTSLDLISGDIRKGLKPGKLIIKPNFVSTSVQLASSHVDQIRGILDYFREFHDKEIIIAEAASPFTGGTPEGFENFGYHQLIEEYDVELVDLNEGPFEKVPILDGKGNTIHVRVSKLLLDRDNYLVSAARLKTHDTVVVTLSIKNMVMGSIYARDKVMVHQGYKYTNLDLAELAGRVWPDLSVIDGLVGMEGNGPEYGTAIDAGIAISSTDPLAADRVACEVMGVDFSKVGYLWYCSEKGLGELDLSRIDIRGQRLKDCIRPFKLHSTVEQQYKWK
ncbi:MAG: DUF362 domain-containing protein [Deferribacteres bacterium]|nr:DUF362 domain-containing protein [Deferribacteres bacterium]